MADDTTEEVEAPPSDPQREELLRKLDDALGDSLLESHIAHGRGLWIRVPVADWRSTAQACRDVVALEYFGFLSVIDWLPYEWGRSENAGALEDAAEEGEAADEATVLIEQGYAGGDSRFQVFAYFHSVEQHIGVVVKADLDDEHPEFETIREVFGGADWHEREAHEMYGVNVPGHPHLANLYLPTGFEGYPMRKDFPLLAREVKPWPGIVDVEPIPEQLEEQLEREVLAAVEAGEA